MNDWSRVALIGTGLLGGSVAAALQARGVVAHRVGYDPYNAQAAHALGLIDEVAPTLAQAVHGAQCVVLAAPVAQNMACLDSDELRAALHEDALLTDVSSTKKSVMVAADRGLGARRGNFVPAHPLAGSEQCGPAAAQADLFQGCWVVLCPEAVNPPIMVQRAEQFWQALGARTTLMTPEMHDRLCAEVSHWPHAVAFALAGGIAGGPLAQQAQALHGPGLRDTTRIAAASPQLWADILLDNRTASLAAAAAFREALAQIEEALVAQDRVALVQALARGARWRQAWRGPSD